MFFKFQSYLWRNILWLIVLLPVASFANNYESAGSKLMLPAKKVTLEALFKKGNSWNKFDYRISLDNQVSLIDQEIMILSAELAMQNNSVSEVRGYMTQLDRIAISPVFSQRLAVLKHYLTAFKSILPSLTPYLTPTSRAQFLDFSMQDNDAIIAIILPLTGRYKKAGNELLESLQDALEESFFSGTIIVFDTQLYTSAFELWETIKHYQPNFIFGPLTKKMTTAWHNLNTKVPSLYFNAVNRLYHYERVLSPNRSKGLEQVFKLLQTTNYQNILVLTDDSTASINLATQFYQGWSLLNKVSAYQQQKVAKTVGQAMEEALNVIGSKGRKSWLQKVIGRDIYFQPRVRKDIEVVISLLSESKALQVVPTINFYQLTNLPHIWYPKQIPLAYSLRKNLLDWQQTFAILPAYIKEQVSHIKESKPSNIEMSDDHLLKTGLFYILGQIAVKIIKNLTISDSDNFMIETKFGYITTHSVGQFYFPPKVYWLDNGAFDEVSELEDSVR